MSGSTSGILPAPIIPQPQHSGDVVGLLLQNAGSSALAAREITFGQVFAPGQVPAGSQLVATIGGQQTPVQMDVKTTNPDGSVATAVLTLEQPTLSANSSANVMLSLAPAGTTAPPALNLAQATASGYNVGVNLTLHNADGTTTPFSFNVGSLLQQALTNGTATYWLNGAQASEASFSVPVSGSLRMVFNVTAYADGSFATDVQFNNDIAMQPVGGAVTYDATILQNGQTVSQHTNLTQYQYQDWHQIVYSNGAPQVNVQHDIAALEKTGVIQNYDLTTGLSSSLVSQEQTMMSGAGWDTPLASNGVQQYMPLVGGRPDIGPTTEYATAWLLSQNQTAAQMTLGWADAAAAVPWHFYDPSEGSYIKVTAIPDIWTDSRGGSQYSGSTGLTQQVDPTNTGWTPEAAHQPDLSFDAYLMTGNQYYLDQLNAQATFSETSYWPAGLPYDCRYDAQGIVASTGAQVRARAWSLREIDEAAYANPAGSAEKAYFTQMENNNWSYLVNQIPTWTAEEGQASGYLGIYSAANGVIAPWQEDYFVSTAVQAAEMGNQDAVTVLKWENNFIAGRFLNAANGFSPYDGFAYHLVINDASGSTYTTWSQLEQATVAAGDSNNGTMGPAGDYAALALMGLAGEITVTSSPLAMKAYGWLYATTYGSGWLSQNPWYTGSTSVANSDLAFNIVPRLADGNSLTAGDVHLFNSTTAGTLAASGADQLIYDLGSANDTIVGGPGVNMLFAGSGNDLLRANGTHNYLFAGSGADTLVGAAGTNYLDASGVSTVIGASAAGPATFSLAETVSATDTIADFKQGTDLLAITDTSGQLLSASEIQTLIAGATTDTAGDAVLHLSPTHSTTLDGISLASLTSSMFASSGGTISNDPTITGAAFSDLNNDGIWQSSESGVGGITVDLIAGGTVAATTTTAANGTYTFGNLAPGTYSVEFVAPPGEKFSPVGTSTTLPDSLVNSSGISPAITLASGQDASGEDAGLFVPGMISGAAFNDPDADGVWQSGESVAAGVTVDLIAGGTVAATATTAANGSYSFGNLAPGSYSVEFVAPTGEQFSPQGTSTTLPDSVVNSSGTTTVTLGAGQTIAGEDAGLFVPGTISGAAFNDPDADGVWQSGESAATGVSVELVSGGTVAATTTTAANGSYSFGNLAPGTYGVQFIAPSGELFSPQGTSTTLPDSTVNSSGAASVTLGAGQTIAGEDAGLYMGPQTIDLTTSGNTVQGGISLLTVIDSAGGNSISGGSGGLNLSASMGADTLTTAATATDHMTLSTGGGPSGTTLIHSNGTDTVSVTSRTTNVYANGPSTLLTETKATIHMTETAGGQNASATVKGGAATLSGGLGQTCISFTATNGAKVMLADPLTVQAGTGSFFVQAGQAGLNIVHGSGAGTIKADPGGFGITALTGDMALTAGSGNMTLKGSNGRDIVQFGAGDATVHGGSGQKLYEFVAGAGGGHDVITGFKVGVDGLQFEGYGHVKVPSSLAAGNSATMHLSDGTTISIFPHP
jgi:SdrD B-like protein/hemolysin type calcium-binding protein